MHDPFSNEDGLQYNGDGILAIRMADTGGLWRDVVHHDSGRWDERRVVLLCVHNYAQDLSSAVV